MLQSTRRRRATEAGGDFISPSCPVCHKSLPSVRNMDPLDHERMVLRHVTRCTSAPERPPSKTGSVLRKREIQTFSLPQGPEESDNTPSFASSPMSSQSHSLYSDVPTIAALDGDNKTSGIDSRVLEVQVPAQPGGPKMMLTAQLPESVENVASVEVSIGELHSPKTMIADGGRTPKIAKETTTLSSLVSAAEFAQPLPLENVASRVDRKLVAARHAQSPVSDAAHCPVCHKLFPRMYSTSSKGYERDVFNHVLACSRGADVPSASIPVKSQQITSKAPGPMPRPPLQDDVQPITRGKAPGADSTASDCSTFTDRSKSLPIAKEPATNKRVISDPRHFLLQTWWRPQKLRRTLPTVPFSLQQCVVVNSEESQIVETTKQRSSRRSQTRSCSNAPNLTLRCPNCAREFTRGWLGSITEESMSRHVTKCMQKIYSTVPLNRTVTANRDADGGGASLPGGKRNRRVLPDNVRKQRKRSFECRAASILAMLDGEGRQALVDMFLASGV
ncbi:hypothetical protein MHU86_12850 [Fragilaria crotonensis]|nr:hypothetical protein MHU86_12850 [Fragilaria crotonensis]